MGTSTWDRWKACGRFVTGHSPVPESRWHENVLGIDTGVQIDERGYGRLTIARIEGKQIETWSFER